MGTKGCSKLVWHGVHSGVCFFPQDVRQGGGELIMI